MGSPRTASRMSAGKGSGAEWRRCSIVQSSPSELELSGMAETLKLNERQAGRLKGKRFSCQSAKRPFSSAPSPIRRGGLGETGDGLFQSREYSITAQYFQHMIQAWPD